VDAQLLILIFAEVLGLYGLIVALIMNTKADGVSVVCTCAIAGIRDTHSLRSAINSSDAVEI
jgi:hypothetical protein